MNSAAESLLLYEREALPVFKIVFPGQKKTLLFLPNNGALPGVIVSPSGDLSPPEMATLKRTFGADFMGTLGIDRGFKTNGTRNNGAWKFVVSGRPLFIDDTIAEMKSKIASALGLESMYIWTLTRLTSTSIRKLITNIFGSSGVMRVGDIRCALSVNCGVGLIDKTDKADLMMTPAQAFEYASVLLEDKTIRTSVGFRYAKTSGVEDIFNVDPSVPSDDDDRLELIRHSPNMMFYDDPQKIISEYPAVNNEFFCHTKADIRVAAHRFYFPVVIQPAFDDDSDAVSEGPRDEFWDRVTVAIMQSPETMLPPDTTLESMWMNDITLFLHRPGMDRTNVSREFSNAILSTRTPVIRLNNQFRIFRDFGKDSTLATSLLTTWLKTNYFIKQPHVITYCLEQSPQGVTFNIANVMTAQGTLKIVNNARYVSYHDVMGVLIGNTGPEIIVNHASVSVLMELPANTAIKSIFDLKHVMDNAHPMVTIRSFEDPSLKFTVKDSISVNIMQLRGSMESQRYHIRLSLNKTSNINAWNYLLRFSLRIIAYMFTSPSIMFAANALPAAATSTEDDTTTDHDFLSDYFHNVQGDLTDSTVENATTNVTVYAADEDKTVLNNLKAADMRLFEYPIVNKNIVKYSTICQKHRQPIVVANTELASFIKKKQSFGVGAIAYGSSTVLAEKNRYICPTVWCPLSRIPMSMEEFEANGKQCPGGSADVPLIRTISKSDQYTQQHIGFQDSSKHPDNLCIPCCFAKPKYWKCDALESSNPRTHSTYIMSKTSSLDEKRMGLLPDFLENVFQNVHSARGLRHDGTGFLKKFTTSCYVRVGLRMLDESQPFLSCMVNALDSPTVKTPDGLIELICERLTPQVFVSMSDGIVARTFVEIIKTHQDRSQYEPLDKFLQRNPDYVKMYSINVERGGMQRERLLQIAFEYFKTYMRDKSVQKSPDLIGGLFNHPMASTWLNPKLYRFVFIDTDAMTMSTLIEDEHILDSKVVFIMSVFNERNNVYEIVGHISSKKPIRLAHTLDVLPSSLVQDIFVSVGQQKNAIHMYNQIHKNGDFVDKLILSYDWAMIGFICGSLKSLRIVMLDNPVCPLPLTLGQSYIYEDEAYAEVGQSPSQESIVDATMFSQEMASRKEQRDSREFTRDDVILLLGTMRDNPEVLTNINRLRNPLSPLPRDTKGIVLFEVLDGILSTTSTAVRMALQSLCNVFFISQATMTTAEIFDTFEDSVMAADTADSKNQIPDEFAFNLDEEDMSVNEIMAFVKNPYARIDRAHDMVMKRVPDVVVLDDTIASKRKQDAELIGDYKPVKHKWRQLLPKFEAMYSSDTLWDIFERACTVLKRDKQYGNDSLKAITTAFIANDDEMLNLVTRTNTAMEHLKGTDIETIRRIVLSGLCEPSFTELCIMSRIIDVRTIVLKRKATHDDDDDGFMCMNNSPTSDSSPHIIVFQHKIDHEKHLDVFTPLVFARRDIVNPEFRFSKDFASFMSERCSCLACWDDKCKLVIDEIAKKKEHHVESLLASTIKKMHQKQKKSTDTYLSKLGSELQG